MKLFSTRQIAEIDRFTIQNEPVADIDLMERAAHRITGWLIKHFTAERKMIFFAGPGNNGGDALAVARQLADLSFQCDVYLLDFGKELKGSPAINWRRLEEQGAVKLFRIRGISEFPVTEHSDIILDGMFGSGLTRPLEGLAGEVTRKINALSNIVVSIDIPSGLMGEDNLSNDPDSIIKADYTLTFQFPKVSFLLAGNEIYTGKWEVLPIGLHPQGIENTPSEIFFTEKEDIQSIIKERPKFAHKGDFGHALLIAGSYGKTGAAVLSSKACLRAGAGLLTTHIPGAGYQIIQSSVPEVMVSIDPDKMIFSELPDPDRFTVIGAGPGLGTDNITKRAFYQLITRVEFPLVIDADGLNILSEEKQWLSELPENSILTPHPGEFARLAGETPDSFARITRQCQFAQEYNVFVVLKGAYTSIATPRGRLFFNSTGNPGMATAGSGDVLTGIILGLLAQKFSPQDAAVAGVYLHGLAGDIAVRSKSEMSLIAGDITDCLGEAVKELLFGQSV
jgi:NAD(P)H-hydrate epimerase